MKPSTVNLLKGLAIGFAITGLVIVLLTMGTGCATTSAVERVAEDVDPQGLERLQQLVDQHTLNGRELTTAVQACRGPYTEALIVESQAVGLPVLVLCVLKRTADVQRMKPDEVVDRLF